MLYERWRQVAREHPRELALCELASNRRWTFRQLADEVERVPLNDQPFCYPQGITAEFILTVLAGWRDGKVLLPLEAGQKPVSVAGLTRDIIHLKTTSASTGTSRLVALTATQLMADANNIVETMRLRADWPNLGVISLAHSYGFSNLVSPLLLHGIPLLLLDSPLPETLRRSAEMFSALTLPAVPALWRAWQEAGTIPKNVRLAISAGAPLPLSLETDVFQSTGLKLHNFYGASECGGIAYDATERPRTEGSCVGAPLRNVSLSIGDDGCLEVRSAAVAKTYWPEPGPSLGGDCYRTSDLAELRGGEVFLRGRASDQINVAGRKIAPEAIERLLLTHPLVLDCLVFGAPSPDEGRAEVIVAGVVARAPVSSETLKQFLLARLPAWQVPRDWWFIDSLAPNARGKLSRAQWRKRYLAEKRKTSPQVDRRESGRI